ncbi:MAG: tRNA-specific 2-thiouridylase [Pseudohongiellaceae bacterium]|jgi:tRNA-specific 2-thiouridylase
MGHDRDQAPVGPTLHCPTLAFFPVAPTLHALVIRPLDTTPRRLLVALSGGVDSATTAALLASQGHELVTVFMRNGVVGSAAAKSCCSLSDARDARAVADGLGVPFYVQDMSKGFHELIESFVSDYGRGLTPNPCVLCNNDLKFGELLELADDLGCDGVATGHYARLENDRLFRAVDRLKDQSYLLHGLTAKQRSRALFPLGELTKDRVRLLAEEFGLKVAQKPDSADICFVPGGDYRAVVAERLGHLGQTGVLVDSSGKTLAEHPGVGAFTVGQRRGLGVALGHPAYVTEIDAESGTVRVGPESDLARPSCQVGQLQCHEPLKDGAEVLVQMRHHHNPERALCRLMGNQRIELLFEVPSRAVTPGQYAVCYQGDKVLAGGRIEKEQL